MGHTFIGFFAIVGLLTCYWCFAVMAGRFCGLNEQCFREMDEQRRREQD